MATLLGRRDLLAGGVATGALALDGRLRGAVAQGAPTITGVTWGGNWVNAWKKLSTKQDAVKVNWVLHAAATTAIVARIKADWPNTPIDFLNASGPTFYMMMREGWLEPLTLQAVPNLAYLPNKLMVKNPAGDIVSVPTNLSSIFWAYDEQAAGIRIENPDDLLSPKLRGKLMLNTPTVGSGAQLILLARSRGGDEHNIEPGFEFVKDLIKAEIVGRVVKTDVEIANAFTTGQVAVGVLNMGNYHVIRPHVKLSLLNKVPGNPTFKTFMGYEGVAVLNKSGNLRPVTDFINFCLDAGNDSRYAADIGTLPSNRLGKASPELVPLALLTPEDQGNFAYFSDTVYISTQTESWNRKWELEIAPLL